MVSFHFFFDFSREENKKTKEKKKIHLTIYFPFFFFIFLSPSVFSFLIFFFDHSDTYCFGMNGVVVAWVCVLNKVSEQGQNSAGPLSYPIQDFQEQLKRKVLFFGKFFERLSQYDYIKRLLFSFSMVSKQWSQQNKRKLLAFVLFLDPFFNFFLLLKETSRTVETEKKDEKEEITYRLFHQG